MRTNTLTKYVCLSLLLVLTFTSVRAQDQEDNGVRSDFHVSLWRASRSEAHLANEHGEGTELEHFLNEKLGSVIRENGLNRIKVHFTGGYDTAMKSLHSGSFSLFECDPGLFFAPEKVLEEIWGESMSELYEPVLQRVCSATGIHPCILVRRDTGIQNLQSLCGKTVAAVHPYAIAGGMAQTAFLEKFDLHPLRDYGLEYTMSAPDALKTVVSGWADAAFVPKDSEKGIWPFPFMENSLGKPLVELATLGPVPGNVFLLQKRFVQEAPELSYQFAETLRAYYGYEEIVRTKHDYYWSLKNLVSEVIH